MKIKESYCSYEVSKLLKEKGFDGECSYYYRCHDKALIKYFPNPGSEDNRFHCSKTWIKKHVNCNHVEYILAPTHQMAMEFIRSKYKIFIQIDYDYYENYGFYYGYSIIKIGKKDKNGDIYLEVGDDICKKYNDIVEAALLCVLKNLF